jgi:hypothetical protein
MRGTFEKSECLAFSMQNVSASSRLVGASVVLVLALLAPDAAACVPTALIAGPDANLVAAVRTRLQGSGISSAQQPGCQSVTAELGARSQEGSLDLVIRDPYGRQSNRTVASVDAAAVLIGSWARTDVTADLLGPEPTETSAALPLVSLLPSPNSSGIGIAAESALGTDSSLWAAARLGGCAQVGSLCVGGQARFAFETSQRLDTEAFASVQLPLSFKHFTLLPGIAAGAGFGYRRNSVEMQKNADEEDQIDKQVATVWHLSPRAEGSLSAWVPMSSRLALDLSVSGSVSPWAQTAPRSANDITVAGEPLAAVRAGIGIRWAWR